MLNVKIIILNIKIMFQAFLKKMSKTLIEQRLEKKQQNETIVCFVLTE